MPVPVPGAGVGQCYAAEGRGWVGAQGTHICAHILGKLKFLEILECTQKQINNEIDKQNARPRLTPFSNSLSLSHSLSASLSLSPSLSSSLSLCCTVTAWALGHVLWLICVLKSALRLCCCKSKAVAYQKGLQGCKGERGEGVALMGTSYSFVVAAVVGQQQRLKIYVHCKCQTIATHTHFSSHTYIHPNTHTHTPTHIYIHRYSCKLCICTCACNLCSGIFNFLKQF